MNRLYIWIAGIPAPKGSTKSFPFKRANGTTGVSTTNANPKTKYWQERVATEAQKMSIDNDRWYIKKDPRGGAVGVIMTFYLPQPKSRKNSGPTTKPDADKLARAILDGLTGVLFDDDSQVVELAVYKKYALNGETPGAQVIVWGCP